MKYRKYVSVIKTGAIVLMTLGLAACATTNSDRSPSSVKNQEETEQRNRFDGREPASLKGDFGWLNQVEDDFGRIADETSSRAVASQNKQEVLMKEKEWSFSFLPKTNNFYLEVQGTSYKMIQTRINDGERFAFAAEGQAENPLTFAVATGENRAVASSGAAASACDTEISFWSKKTKAYVTERVAVKGKACERMLTLLKDYVP